MTGWRRLFDRRRRRDDLQDEIRAHLAMDTHRRVAARQDARSAERAAIKEFGNVMLTRERTQRMWSGERVFEALRYVEHDVRYALRILRR